MLGLGNEWGTKSRFALVCTEKMSRHTGKAEINQTMQRFDVFFYRSLKMYSTNILIQLVTENLMFVVLRCEHAPIRRMAFL